MRTPYNLTFKEETEKAYKNLEITTRYAKTWKWIPGQNGPTRRRTLTEAERQQYGLR
jgi:hypothetical protein